LVQAWPLLRQEGTAVSKFKIEHRASRINLVLLKTSIEDTIAQDIDLLASWSDNDRKYIVNELLRFALTQEEDFLKYKVSVAANSQMPAGDSKPAPIPAKHTSDVPRKPEPLPSSTTTHI
jgi:hypothetical protein